MESDDTALDTDGSALESDDAALDTDDAGLHTDGSGLESDGSALESDGSGLDADDAALDADDAALDTNGCDSEYVKGPLGTIDGPKHLAAFFIGGKPSLNRLTAQEVDAGFATDDLWCRLTRCRNIFSSHIQYWCSSFNCGR